MKTTSTKFLTQAAMIAALYVALTYLASLLGLSSGAVQLRFSEALTILPYFTEAAVPGVTLGCLIANILTGAIAVDVIFGTIATLIGAVGTYLLRKYKYAAPVPPIVANTLIVPFILRYGYGIRGIGFHFLTVGIGEVISCGVFGILLLIVISKYRNVLFTSN